MGKDHVVVSDQGAQVRAFSSPFDEGMGTVIDSATVDEVTAHLDVDPQRHATPLGTVHGGVHCTLVETVASYGAALSAAESGRVPVGMENHTSFLRPVSSGRLHVVGRAINRGAQTHLWEVLIRDDEGRLVARGSLRLAIITPREGAFFPGSTAT
ncbi:MAG TPA: PaaI family thioesterase [Candidatus Sulfotelmatobacter sp.]|nr:PaaI family thioesterase [Candidatus Sulfotelmatobacter sp.]